MGGAITLPFRALCILEVPIKAMSANESAVIRGLDGEACLRLFSFHLPFWRCADLRHERGGSDHRVSSSM